MRAVVARRAGVFAASLALLSGVAFVVPTAAIAEPAPAGATTTAATVTGPVTGGVKGYPFGSAEGVIDLAGAGYVEQEFFLAGNAVSYTATTPLPSSGVWTAAPSATTAAYKTRALVRRPADPAKFNGTVIVEWLNVTAGHDTDPDFSYGYQQLLRAGFAWVGVSAQSVSVNGSPLLPGFGLKAWDATRYGSLTHPGDSYSYDIFTQAARALRAPGAVDMLGGLVPKRLIADGESQSASRMVTYVNAVQPLANAFDGFLVHSRSGSAAGLSQAPQANIPAPATTFIRTDLTVPVFVVQTETDILGSLASRQIDSKTYARWELAGTAHADWWFLRLSQQYTDRDLPTYPKVSCVSPVNDGPQHWVFNAVIDSLDRWVRTGTRPSAGTDITVASGQLVRDAYGNVLGGVRTPQLDVPLATLTGVGNTGTTAAGNLFCRLFGTSAQLPKTTIDSLYRNNGAYVSTFAQGANATYKAGFFVADDLDAIKAEAAQSHRVFTLPPAG